MVAYLETWGQEMADLNEPMRHHIDELMQANGHPKLSAALRQGARTRSN